MIPGSLALVASALAFLVPLAIPLFAARWRTFLVMLALGALFFGWLNWDIEHAAPGAPGWIGPFLGGLMLVGFTAGTIAKFVMLLAHKH